MQSAEERENLERMKIEKRRQVEADRRQRLLNAKSRVMGIDKEALDAQVREKQMRKAMEAERDRMFDDELLRTEKQILLMEQQHQRDRRAVNVQTENFRIVNQPKQQRSEYDLSDPRRLLEDHPARVGDEDQRTGPASMQKFYGEDLSLADRKKKQQAQQRAWLQQQVQEKEERKLREKTEDNVYAVQATDVDSTRGQMEQREKAARKAADAAASNYNKALANARAIARQEERVQNMRDNVAEINNNLSSDFLNETRSATRPDNPTRVLGSEFKGLSRDAAVALAYTRESQIHQKTIEKYSAKQETENWDLVTEAVRRNVLVGDREIERRKKEIQRQLLAENRRQAAEQRERNEYVNRVVYQNVIEPSYFEQFGKSSR